MIPLLGHLPLMWTLLLRAATAVKGRLRRQFVTD